MEYMPNKIAQLAASLLPKCPICGSSVGYESASRLANTFRCLSCGAKWGFYSVWGLNKNRLGLIKAANDGRGKGLKIQWVDDYLPISFWQSLSNPNIFLCPQCSTSLKWICSSCGKKVHLHEDCPKCETKLPETITCANCHTLLQNEKGFLMKLTVKPIESSPAHNGQRKKIPCTNDEAKAIELVNAAGDVNAAMVEKYKMKKLCILGGNSGLLVATEQEISKLEQTEKELLRQAYLASPTYTKQKLMEAIEYAKKMKVKEAAAYYLAILASCEQQQSADSQERDTIQKKARYCPYCGEKRKNDADFCGNCGKKIV